MSIGTKSLATLTLLAVPLIALADPTLLKCQGEWRSGPNMKPAPTEFSLQIDLGDNSLLDYTMFGTPSVPKPESRIVGEVDGSSLIFTWPAPTPSFHHVIGIDRATGQFRHFMSPESGDMSEMIVLVRGKCEKTAAVF